MYLHQPKKYYNDSLKLFRQLNVLVYRPFIDPLFISYRKNCCTSTQSVPTQTWMRSRVPSILSRDSSILYSSGKKQRKSEFYPPITKLDRYSLLVVFVLVFVILSFGNMAYGFLWGHTDQVWLLSQLTLFSGVNALCSKLVFHTFLCCPLRYLLEI